MCGGGGAEGGNVGTFLLTPARVTIPAHCCLVRMPDHSGMEGHWNVLGGLSVRLKIKGWKGGEHNTVILVCTPLLYHLGV